MSTKTPTCDICGKEIPLDFQQPICMECYRTMEKQNKKAEKENLSKTEKKEETATNPKNIPDTDPVTAPEAMKNSQDRVTTPDLGKFGIIDPNYQENAEMDDKDQILANLAQFIYTHNSEKKTKGKLLWYPTRNMYNYIRNYCIQRVTAHPQYPKHIHKPRIVDVGCGCGVGSNVMSVEADFVWGIDKNEWSVEFAQEAFTREKNGIYYNSQVTFDVIDIIKDNREFMKFDIVVAIEIIEHVHDTYKFLDSLTQFTRKNKRGDCHIEGATEFFISTPNRNSPKIQKDKPKNPYHCKEWTSEEFHGLLSHYFEHVEFMDNKGQSINKSCNDDIILAKCIYPKMQASKR